jgi:indolepyruvate ferredoxin oxidoreductase beta subunit
MTPHPVGILIAALGGEGGGVLSHWIVAAANAHGFPVQSTSIPGVAQRTGATTYYVEIIPMPTRDLGGRRPVLALAPGIGDVDLIVASELVEAGRTIAGGFATSDRTTMIASTHRAYAMAEKAAMGDGRYDEGRLRSAIAAHTRTHILFDMEATARESGAMINAVMLGAIAGSGCLPLPAQAYEAAIRADGKAVEANLRGFRAGLDAALRPPAQEKGPVRDHEPARASAALTSREQANIPEPAREVVQHGVARLAAYQDDAYARLYLERLAAICAADARLEAGGRLAAAAARHLAVRMSYEDVIRVAQAKIDPARFARIAREMKAGPDDPVVVVDYLKPGIEELCQLLPPRLATRILSLAERRGWRVHWGMEIKTSSISGYVRFWLLAKLRAWRPRTHRYAQEQRQIDEWLALVLAGAEHSVDLAVEIAECARLIKGYGDTLQRGMGNYRLLEAHVIRPALAGRLAGKVAADAVANARTAALLDPDGEGLARCLAEIETHTGPPFAAA